MGIFTEKYYADASGNAIIELMDGRPAAIEKSKIEGESTTKVEDTAAARNLSLSLHISCEKGGCQSCTAAPKSTADAASAAGKGTMAWVALGWDICYSVD